MDVQHDPAWSESKLEPQPRLDIEEVGLHPGTQLREMDAAVDDQPEQDLEYALWKPIRFCDVVFLPQSTSALHQSVGSARCRIGQIPSVEAAHSGLQAVAAAAF